MDPKISVITATHNRPDMLKRAIASVLSQTFVDFEYIIVDDRSDQATRDVVESFVDQRIVYIRNEENPHQTHCRPLNVGLKHARGEYVAYLDDDNEWMSFHLEVLVNALESDGLDVAYCDFLVVDEDGSLQPGISMDFDPQFLLMRNFIDTSNVLHKKEFAFKVGGWDEEVLRFTDWNLWVRMMKSGAYFKRVPIAATKYHNHGGDTQSRRTEVESWYDPYFGMTMFKPTFDPTGCFIHLPYLGGNSSETNPKVAIFTLTYERLDYTKRMWASLNASTHYPFKWFVVDQASTDGTKEYLEEIFKGGGLELYVAPKNMGITGGSNTALEMMGDDYDIIIKVDNDCEFMTFGWLESLIDLWKRNHMLYMSPYPEGLVNNPGGAPRVGQGIIGPYNVEITEHIGGLCALIDARAYQGFWWTDQFKHGNQDWEASMAFKNKGYMPCYIPLHRVMHMDTTSGQQKKYKEYFERRKREKTEVA